MMGEKLIRVTVFRGALVLLLLACLFVGIVAGCVLAVNWAFPGIWEARNAMIDERLNKYTTGCLARGFSESQCVWLDSNFKPMWR